jgi:hypothetical protein
VTAERGRLAGLKACATLGRAPTSRRRFSSNKAKDAALALAIALTVALFVLIADAWRPS